mmetsp:Transcript_4372/g.12618  ORF Transcript_4372/g.12618 Transcript_4372/m.12618 type:complete len:459 (-) Transcript_4372:2094-3470(-)
MAAQWHRWPALCRCRRPCRHHFPRTAASLATAPILCRCQASQRPPQRAPVLAPRLYRCQVPRRRLRLPLAALVAASGRPPSQRWPRQRLRCWAADCCPLQCTLRTMATAACCAGRCQARRRPLRRLTRTSQRATHQTGSMADVLPAAQVLGPSKAQRLCFAASAAQLPAGIALWPRAEPGTRKATETTHRAAVPGMWAAHCGGGEAALWRGAPAAAASAATAAAAAMTKLACSTATATLASRAMTATATLSPLSTTMTLSCPGAATAPARKAARTAARAVRAVRAAAREAVKAAPWMLHSMMRTALSMPFWAVLAASLLICWAVLPAPSTPRLAVLAAPLVPCRATRTGLTAAHRAASLCRAVCAAPLLLVLLIRSSLLVLLIRSFPSRPTTQLPTCLAGWPQPRTRRRPPTRRLRCCVASLRCTDCRTYVRCLRTRPRATAQVHTAGSNCTTASSSS